MELWADATKGRALRSKAKPLSPESLHRSNILRARRAVADGHYKKMPRLCGALILPCPRKNGGLRPIAAGEVLHRLTSKCAARAVLQESTRILSPLQVGVGVPGGCEAIIHSVSVVLEDNTIPPDRKHVLLVNALNSVSCQVLFEVRLQIPSLSPWMECSYGSQPVLRLDDHSIRSCCRVQQGDPLGPLGFSLALHHVVQKTKEQVPGLLINTWYLDDGTLCGSTDDLARAFAIIESDGPSHGLILNKAKSFIFVPPNSSASHPLLTDIPSTSEAFTLRSSPIGPSSFCESTVSAHVDKIKVIISNLSDLQDAQMEKAFLPSSSGGLTIRHTALHAPG